MTQTTFKAEQIILEAAHVDDTLTLPFELRQKSRLVATLASGRQLLLSLPRGNVLRHGALLLTNEGSVVQVRSAVEVLSLASAWSAAITRRRSREPLITSAIATLRCRSVTAD
jgi:urease accessory protein